MKFVNLALAFAWAARAETPVAAKLCDMVERPDQFKDKLVSVRAEVITGFEMQALIDGSCPSKRIWLELDEPKRDNGYNALNRAWKNNDFNFRKKVTATVLGLYDTGNCFGHNCFSKAQLRARRVSNITAVERRLAPDFSAHDCNVLTGDIKVHLRKGHFDYMHEAPVFLPSSQVVLTGPHDDPVVAEARPIFQIALTPNRLKVLEPKNGVIDLSSLPLGAYVFSAVAIGFQSVSGCFVITPKAIRREPVKIELPLGV